MKAKYKIGLIVVIVGLVVAAMLTPAGAQYSTKVYKNGPDTLTAGSGGTIEVLSGGTLDVKSGSTATLAGANTLSGATAISGAVSVTGAFTHTSNVIDYTTTATARTVTAAESGTIFTVSESSDDPVTFTLPPAAKGLTYTFSDMDVTAAADLTLQAGAGDTINGGTAAKQYWCTGDAVKQTVTIVAVDSTNWIVVSEVGTWANNNS